MVSRKQAFRIIREEIGVEICPAIRKARVVALEAIQGLPSESRAEARRAVQDLEGCAATAHHLRHALVALLALHNDPETVRCPGCQKMWDVPDHDCHLTRILARSR